jgi:hypothetical protein
VRASFGGDNRVELGHIDKVSIINVIYL